MASTDATPIPVKNQAYRVTFPILDADGDLVAGATGLDSEVSKDAGTFVDCTNEATEIASGSGMYYLDLTATEMNADTVGIIVKTGTAGAKTTPMVLYPNKAGGLAVNVTAWAGSATATNQIAIKTTLAKGTDLTGFNDIAAGAAMTLTSAYDAAKTAATQTSVNTIDDFVDTEVAAIKTVTDKLDTALVADAAVWQFTANALELGPAGGGGGGDASQATLLTVKAVTDKLDTMTQLDGAVYRYTANALEQAPTGTGGGGATDPWEIMLPGSYAIGTAGYILGINLDAPVSTRSTYTGTDTPGTTDLLTRIPGPITVTSGKVDVNDKTGFSLTSAYDAAKTAASQTSVNAIDTVTDKLDTMVEVDGAVWRYTANALETSPSGGGGGTGDAMQSTLLQVKAKTDNLPIDPADASDIAASFTVVNGALAALSSYVDTEVAAIKAKTDALPSDPADASDIASSFSSMGAQLTVIDDYIDTEISAIKAKTDQMTFTGGKIDANTDPVVIPPIDLNAIADTLLKRDWTAVTGEAQYSALNAFRMLRNAWNTAGGTLTVKKEDGSTTAWTRSLSTDPAAQPITAAT